MGADGGVGKFPSIEELVSDALGRVVADWWFVFILISVIVVLRVLVRSRGGSERRYEYEGSGIVGYESRRYCERSYSDTLSGKAWVTDGDGIRVGGEEVRLAGLDAPEWNQMAADREGVWFCHGKAVKSALIDKVGGQIVVVHVEGRDKYGRLLGTVTFDGIDVGAWLVREGHAWAMYSRRYAVLEMEARLAGRGLWGHSFNYDPRAHRAWDGERAQDGGNGEEGGADYG